VEETKQEPEAMSQLKMVDIMFDKPLQEHKSGKIEVQSISPIAARPKQPESKS
jgi:hypothetical protein